MIEILPPRLYSARQVFCDWMGYGRLRWYRDNWKKLLEDGFPRPIPKPGRPLWRGEDLLAWARRRDQVKDAVTGGGNVVSLAELARARSAGLKDRRKRA